MCDCTGKIEIPADGKIVDGRLVTWGIKYLTCDQCKGRGWILMPPIVADEYPENVVK